jgi:hypothetical protein
MPGFFSLFEYLPWSYTPILNTSTSKAMSWIVVTKMNTAEKKVGSLGGKKDENIEKTKSLKEDFFKKNKQVGHQLRINCIQAIQ